MSTCARPGGGRKLPRQPRTWASSGCSRLRRQSHETVFVDEGLEWLERGDQDIDPEVALKSLNQKRVRYVLLNHRRVRIAHFVDVVENVDTSTTRQTNRLDDPEIS